jgi:hypothetical protein
VPKERLDRRFVTGRQEMRIAFDEHDSQPATVGFQPEQIPVQRVIPAGPGLPQIMLGQCGIEGLTTDLTSVY